MTELEEVIIYLNSRKKVTITAMAKKAGLDRMTFHKTRNGQNQEKKERLAKSLIEGYAQYFENGEIPSAGAISGKLSEIEQKYIDLLERDYKRIQDELGKIKKENLQLLGKLEELSQSGRKG